LKVKRFSRPFNLSNPVLRHQLHHVVARRLEVSRVEADQIMLIRPQSQSLHRHMFQRQEQFAATNQQLRQVGPVKMNHNQRLRSRQHVHRVTQAQPGVQQNHLQQRIEHTFVHVHGQPIHSVPQASDSAKMQCISPPGETNPSLHEL